MASKKKQPRVFLEAGNKGRIGVLRDLHQIQLSVPDKYFFVNRYRRKGGTKDKAGKKKDGSGFFSGLPLMSRKKIPKLDLVYAVEKVKQFHNSFQFKSRNISNTKASEAGLMNVSAMNAFRKEIKNAVSYKDCDFRWHALEAVVQFIDLKNSGIMKDKQLIQQDCLRKIGESLNADGGLSMFHATWFLTVYKDYLAGFKIFRKGEIDNINRHGGVEGANILKRLQRKQFEIPIYLQLVGDKQPDVRQLRKYSKDLQVKRSKHGHSGCTRHNIRQIFHERFKNAGAEKDKTTKINEVNIIMSYAMLFTRIPMMYETVEFIKSAIPHMSTETNLYKQKITIGQKVVLLNIASVLSLGDGSDEGERKLFQLAISVYKYCVEVISDLRLDSKPLENSIYTHPIMKQAAILITYKSIFSTKKDIYLDLLKRSKELLKPVQHCSRDTDRVLINIAGYAELYIKKLDDIEHHMQTNY